MAQPDFRVFGHFFDFIHVLAIFTYILPIFYLYSRFWPCLRQNEFIFKMCGATGPPQKTKAFQTISKGVDEPDFRFLPRLEFCGGLKFCSFWPIFGGPSAVPETVA